MSYNVTLGAQGAIAGGTIAIGGLNLGSGQEMSTADEITYMNGLTLKIVSANGGTIVTIRSEGPMIASNPDIYVIPEDKDIGAELSKIITMHYLKK